MAEQIAVDCGAADPEQLLALRGVVDRRMLAVLRLAGDAGESAGQLLLGEPTPPARRRSHDLVTAAGTPEAGLLDVDFEWRTSGYRVLFDVLSGHLRARPAPSGAVLSVEGTYHARSRQRSRPPPSAERRAAEVAVRVWLGQLRAALEDPAREVRLGRGPMES